MKHLCLILILLIFALPVKALTSPSVSASEVGCDANGLPIIDVTVTASFATDDNPGIDQAAIRVYDGAGQWVNSSGVYWTTGEVGTSRTVRFGVGGTEFAANTTGNPIRVVFSDSAGVDVDLAETIISVSCYAGASEDGETSVIFGTVSVPSAGLYLYPTVDEESATGMSVWAVNEDNEGFSVAMFTAAQLEAHQELELEENMELASAEGGVHGEVHVYLLTTGEYQINVGADEEGWVRVTIISGFGTEDVEVYQSTYNIYATPSP